MTISDFAPYALGFLIFIAILVYVLMCQIKGKERDRGDSCFLTGVLIFLLVAIIWFAWLWAAEIL
jgi:hypothetical protein